jgi:hypothetical protein
MIYRVAVAVIKMTGIHRIDLVTPLSSDVVGPSVLS